MMFSAVCICLLKLMLAVLWFSSYCVAVIWVSLSEPHTSLTAHMHVYVCLDLACLEPTTYCKSLPALINLAPPMREIVMDQSVCGLALGKCTILPKNFVA